MEKTTTKEAARPATSDLSPGEKGFVYLRDNLPQVSYKSDHKEVKATHTDSD